MLWIFVKLVTKSLLVIFYHSQKLAFDFLYKCKNISISSFCLKTRNGNIVQIFGYDEIADFLYSHLAINDDVYVEGYLTSFKNNISVNIININKIM